jgi:diguanylate cyclase (GGDEF)-like protein/hemerythrin-like metal-binding protein/PAS domain S-box-containing protein
MGTSIYADFFYHSTTAFAVMQKITDEKSHQSDFQLIEANPTFLDLLQENRETAIGKTYLAYMKQNEMAIDPDILATITDIFHQKPTDQQTNALVPGKSIRLRTFPLSIDQIGVILRDVTNDVQNSDTLDAFMSINVDMFCKADPNGYFLKVNKQFETILGYSIEEMEGIDFFSLIHEDDVASTRGAMEDLKNQKEVMNFVNRYRCKDGSYKYLEWRAVPSGDFYYSSARDITALVKKEEGLRNAAIIDLMTGLYNRNFFYGRVNEEIAHSQAEHQTLSMIAVDIDHFKYVNDIWGHPVGDEVLERTARMMKNNIRSTDLIARVGGEEFVVLLPNTGIEGALVVANKIHEALNANPHPRIGKVTASFGVAERFIDEDFTSWYKRADDAVYVAKARGRNQAVVAGDTALTGASKTLYTDWKPEWNSGNQTIDEDHKHLVDIGNHLTYLSVSGAIPAQISNQIDQLILHVANHFAHEEEILENVNYPLLAEHRKIHHNLLVQTSEQAFDYRNKPNKSPIFLAFVMNDLIVGHMQNEDRKFFPYLSETQK